MNLSVAIHRLEIEDMIPIQISMIAISHLWHSHQGRIRHPIFHESDLLLIKKEIKQHHDEIYRIANESRER